MSFLIPDPGDSNNKYVAGNAGNPKTTTVNGTGSAPAPQPIAEPNPYDDPAPLNHVLIDDMEVPGTIQPIEGAEKEEEWNVQKGTGTTGATTVWKGTKLAEAIKIITKLYSWAAYNAYIELRKKLRPKVGSKPPSFVIKNPTINFNGITKVSLKNISPPKWEATGFYWIGEITLIENNPSKAAPTGPNDPAKPPKDPTPNDSADKEIQKLLNEANKI